MQAEAPTRQREFEFYLTLTSHQVLYRVNEESDGGCEHTLPAYEEATTTDQNC